MIITNKTGLPVPFVSMARQEYTIAPNEYRVTSLLKGIRETMLERRHNDEIERDASDMVWLLFGTAVHSILEHHEEGADEIKESRVKVDVGERVLSGQFDLYNDTTGTITDYKTCSVWKIIFGDFEDWRRQTLIYCWMMRRIGFNAHRAEVVAIMKDHSKTEAKRKADYPKMPVKKITFEFTEADFEEIGAWINEKFEEIAFAESLSDSELPLCTAEERFNSGDKYAVMKKGRQKAIRVLGNMEDALQMVADGGGDYVEERAGVDKKCVDYCSACKFCEHWRNNVKTEEAAING